MLRSLLLVTVTLLSTTFVNAAPTHPDYLKIEGVYKTMGPEGMPLNLTFLYNTNTGKVNLTVAHGKFFFTVFSAKEVNYQKINNDEFLVTAFSKGLKGAYSYLEFTINLKDMSIEGIADSNFLETEGPFEMKGQRQESFYELLALGGTNTGGACPAVDQLIGKYVGKFVSKENATLNIRQIPDGTGGKMLVSNINFGSKLLFHHGTFSPSHRLLTFISDISSYIGKGRFKKLLLICDQDADHYILRGIHIASTGQIVRDVEFKKAK